MRKLTLALAATTALTMAAGATHAQGWMSINQRQAQLDQRIDVGLRNGDLTMREAANLRADMADLNRLEMRYRRDGLSAWERSDLDRRFDVIAQQIRIERRDDQMGWFGGRGWTDNRGRWVGIEQRKMQLDRRIDQGLRSGQLTAAEAARLRADFDDIARVEYRYRRDGLSAGERADLDRRFDRLAAQIRWERTDRQRQYGYNR